MEIAKLASVAITATLLIVVLKDKNPVFALLTALAATVIMAGYTVSELGEIFADFERLFEVGGIDASYGKIIIKVIAVAYFTEITSALCRDAGETAIAQKLDLAGRVAVLILTVPAVSQLMTVIIEALNLI